MLEQGTIAPGFSLPDHEGATVSLADFSGRWVVLWWYPKANTPGCALEGQTYRDLTPEFDAAHEQAFVAHVRRLVGPEMSVALARVGPTELKRGPTGKVPLVLSAVKRARAVAEGSENAV